MKLEVPVSSPEHRTRHFLMASSRSSISFAIAAARLAKAGTENFLYKADRRLYFESIACIKRSSSNSRSRCLTASFCWAIMAVSFWFPPTVIPRSPGCPPVSSALRFFSSNSATSSRRAFRSLPCGTFCASGIKSVDAFEDPLACFARGPSRSSSSSSHRGERRAQPPPFSSCCPPLPPARDPRPPRASWSPQAARLPPCSRSLLTSRSTGSRPAPPK